VRRAAGRDRVVEYLILVGRARDAVLARWTAVLLQGAQQDLLSPAAVARAPGVAAALFRVADAHPQRRVRGVATAAGRRRGRGRAGTRLRRRLPRRGLPRRPPP